MTKDLRAALRAAAEQHKPDREAMLDRITRTAMSNEPAEAPGRLRMRTTAAAAAVLAVLGVGGVVRWSLAGDPQPAPTPTPPATSAATPRPSTTASVVPTPRRSVASTRTPTTPRATRLRATGSAEKDLSTVTLTTTEPLTALEVTIRIAATAGLRERSGSQRVPGASVTGTVTREGNAVVYRFVLSSADTLRPGTYQFFARYTQPADSRNSGGDSFTAYAKDADGAPLRVTGGFG